MMMLKGTVDYAIIAVFCFICIIIGYQNKIIIIESLLLLMRTCEYRSILKEKRMATPDHDANLWSANRRESSKTRLIVWLGAALTSFNV